MEYYSALKWNKILMQAIILMNPEDKLVKCQSQKDKGCMNSLVWSSKNSQIHKAEQWPLGVGIRGEWRFKV